MYQKKYLYEHTSQETAYTVENYPWGFRLRTTIRYWIETKKGFGQRFCSQTINPKTGVWCKPKCGTYSPIIILFLDENEHIKQEYLDFNDSIDTIEKFKERHLNFLTDFQKNILKEIIAYNKVMENVTFTVTRSEFSPVSLFSNKPEDILRREQIKKEQEQRKIEQQKIEDEINFAISSEKRKVIL